MKLLNALAAVAAVAAAWQQVRARRLLTHLLAALLAGAGWWVLGRDRAAA